MRATSLMPIHAFLPEDRILLGSYGANDLRTIDQITREAIRLFRNSNWFLRTVGREFDAEFAATGRRIGDQLRIRLPNDYKYSPPVVDTTFRELFPNAARLLQ